MSKTLRLAAVFLGAALLAPASTLAGVPAPARLAAKAEGTTQVRRGHTGFHRSFVHRRPPVVFYAAPLLAYPYYGGYGGHCSWLLHKARVTGSRYWWRRYHYEC